MESPLPPDPYTALGVPKNADSALIKSTYRKLALKCHPDKVTDESKKAEATEKFHSIQQAYDILSDEERRERYDVQVKLAELRRQNMEARNQSASRDVRNAGYETRTAAPQFTSFASRGPTRVFEERRPSLFDDDIFLRASSRRFEFSYVKRPSPKEKEKEERRERAHASDPERKRTERRRGREAEVRESRDRKNSYVEEEFARYEAERRQRDKEEEARRSEPPRRPPLRREEMYPEDQKTAEAQRYMASQEPREAPRPTMPRRSSANEIPTIHTYARRATAEKDHRSPRPSSPKDTSPNKAASKKSPENVEPYERRPHPTAQYSAPSNIPTMSSEAKDSGETKRPQSTPHRSYTLEPEFLRRKEGIDDSGRTTSLPRAHTWNTVPEPTYANAENSTSYKRTNEPTPGPDSGYSSAVTPDGQYKFYPPPPSNPKTTRTTYVYPKDAGSSNTTPKAESGNKFENYTPGGYRVEEREPGISGRRGQSPPRERDAKILTTAQKMAHLASSRPHAASASRSTPYAYPNASTARPPMMGQSSSSRTVPRVSRSPERVSSGDDRGRYERERERGRNRERDRARDLDRDYYRDDGRRNSEKLYGEMGPGYIRATQANSNSFVGPDGVSYSRRFRDEDVVYAGGSRGSRERVYDDRRPPPSFSRSATTPVGAY